LDKKKTFQIWLFDPAIQFMSLETVCTRLCLEDGVTTRGSDLR